MRARAFIFWGLTAAVGWGCHSPVDDPNSTIPGRCGTTVPTISAQKTDILVMVDNSNSMKDKQELLARELPAFISVLQRGAGVSQDFQVGLITSSVYENAFVKGPGGVPYDCALFPVCRSGAPRSRVPLFGSDGGVFTCACDYPKESGQLQPVPGLAADGGLIAGTEKILQGSDPDLVAKFARLVRAQGISGSGQETPFEAVRLAVTDLATRPVADGGTRELFRDGAQLLVVIVSDDDDCSATARPPQVWVDNDSARDTCHEQQALLTPVADYFQIFRGLTDGQGAPRNVLWESIAPVALGTKAVQQVLEAGVLHNINCPNAEGTGFRHREMATLFDPSLQNLDSVCDQSFHDALLGVAGRAIATQTVGVSNIPDPRLLRVEITRADGTVQVCTLSNGGVRFDQADGGPAQLHFQGACQRSAADQLVQLKLLCAG